MANRSDNFNRTDSSSAMGTPSDAGSDWVALTGTWGIASNRGYCATDSGDNQNSAVLESSASDVDVEVTCTTGNNDQGIILRATDASNYILLRHGTDGSVIFYKREAGTFTSFASTSGVSQSNGDVIKATASGNDFELFVNGVSALTGTSSFNNTATKHGLRVYSSTTPRWEDFSITDTGGGGGGLSIPIAMRHYLRMMGAG